MDEARRDPGVALQYLREECRPRQAYYGGTSDGMDQIFQRDASLLRPDTRYLDAAASVFVREPLVREHARSGGVVPNHPARRGPESPRADLHDVRGGQPLENIGRCGQLGGLLQGRGSAVCRHRSKFGRNVAALESRADGPFAGPERHVPRGLRPCRLGRPEERPGGGPSLLGQSSRPSGQADPGRPGGPGRGILRRGGPRGHPVQRQRSNRDGEGGGGSVLVDLAAQGLPVRDEPH